MVGFGLTSYQPLRGRSSIPKCSLRERARRSQALDPTHGRAPQMAFSLFTYHFSLITFHLSLFTYHFSLITFHLSLFTFHFPSITSSYAALRLLSIPAPLNSSAPGMSSGFATINCSLVLPALTSFFTYFKSLER